MFEIEYDRLTEFECEIEIDRYTNGLKFIDSGLYASVYDGADRYPGCVIKVFEDDYGYLSFLRAMKTAKPNPNLPRIEWARIIRIRGSREFVGIVAIEKLQGLFSSAKYADFDYDHIDETTIGLMLRRLEDYVMYDIRDVPRRWQPLVRVIRRAHRLSRRVCDGTSYRSSLDLHSDNVMRRGRNFVVTDPLS